MKPQLTYILGLLTFASANVLKREQCAEDYCFRAVRQTQRPGVGAADCASYWPASQTFTPAAVTVTITATATESFTQTDSQTLTNTLYDTLTITQATTVTAETVEVTSTITRNLITDAPELPEFKLRKRADGSITFSDATSTGVVPAYLSWCSGWFRYSSACSCVTKDSTFTAPTPTSTITVTQVTVSETATISPTLATVDVTLVDASTTIFDPVATTTETATVSTVTWVAIYIGARDDDPNKASQFLKVGPSIANFDGVARITWTSNADEATKFNLDLSTHKLKVEATQEFVCAQFTIKDAVYIYVMNAEREQYFNTQRLDFEYDVNNNILVQTGEYNKLGYTTDSGDHLIIAKSGVNWGRFKAREVSLEVISA